jgi:uncharacterized protein YceH (UPF0502 family)
MVCCGEGCVSPTWAQRFPENGVKGSDILSLVDGAEDHDGKVLSDSKMASPQSAPEWKPLTAKQRRVLGTLMEKSKTTPDAYPMTFTGLCTGCNQKSNRAPLSNYTSEQVETIVDELRSMGALTIVQGLGRVTKVRHYAYNWLGLSKVEAAVMTELLLRGEQTLGELRTRAARMEPINDIQHMSELFAELKRRNLVVELGPPGRGQMVSHNLYPEWELEQIRKSVASGSVGGSEESSGTAPFVRQSPTGSPSNSELVGKLETEMESLKIQVTELANRLDRLEKDLGVS